MLDSSLPNFTCNLRLLVAEFQSFKNPTEIHLFSLQSESIPSGGKKNWPPHLRIRAEYLRTEPLLDKRSDFFFNFLWWECSSRSDEKTIVSSLSISFLSKVDCKWNLGEAEDLLECKNEISPSNPWTSWAERWVVDNWWLGWGIPFFLCRGFIVHWRAKAANIQSSLIIYVHGYMDTVINIYPEFNSLVKVQ